MPVFVVVNHVEEIGYRQTTALLIASLLNRGHEVCLANVDNFSFVGLDDQNEFSINALGLDTNSRQQDVDSKLIEGLASSKQNEPQRYVLGSQDIVMIRTNPGRDTCLLYTSDAADE